MTDKSFSEAFVAHFWDAEGFSTITCSAMLQGRILNYGRVSNEAIAF